MTDEKTLIELQKEQIKLLEEHMKTLKDVIAIKEDSMKYLQKTIALDEIIIQKLALAFQPCLN